MKIKELKKTVNVCWSPKEHYPIMLATGSSAQQVDASFSSNSNLEVYSLNLEDPGYDLDLKSSMQTQHKFQKLVWSDAGVLVGGCDGGLLQFYNVDKLINSPNDALIGSSTKHTGQVSALDINPYQKNLLASGAADSEILIWDLYNTAQPMAPGARSQPHDHVQALAWNHQVQHILGSTFGTRCVVWDLRKNEPIMKLSDSQSRTRWRSLSWHPRVATQLVIASEDDLAPVIQLWDLRLAASPVVTLEGHTKGVLALSWSGADPDLLLSAAKDGRVLCWNPNNTAPSGEMIAEVSSEREWVFEAAWCPRSPALFATAAFDGHVGLHSLLGGSKPDTSPQSQSNIMDSFGGVDTFSQLPAVTRAPGAPPPSTLPFPRAPVWLRRPARAAFAFGGKLVTVPQEAGSHRVHISQVVTEPDMVQQAQDLAGILPLTHSEDPVSRQRLAEFCLSRGDGCEEQDMRYLWFFLRANFLPDFRAEALNLLGFKKDEIPSKFKNSTATIGPVESITSGVAGLSRGESTETETELSPDTSTDVSEAHTLIERRLAEVDEGPAPEGVIIPDGEDPTSVICRALVCGNLEEAVELCLEADRMADALIIASIGSGQLMHKVQKYYLGGAGPSPVSLLSGALRLGRWSRLVQGAGPSSWRHTLAAILTHCDRGDAALYSEMLGDRLSKEGGADMRQAAMICYVCAGTVTPLLTTGGGERTALALLAHRAAPGSRPLACPAVAAVAARLAGQGCMREALDLVEGSGGELADRLRSALGVAGAGYTPAPTHRDTTRPEPAQYERPWTGGYTQPGPRPGSVGPQPGHGVTSRSKYRVDPSVQSAPLYGQYAFTNSAVTQPGPLQSYPGYEDVTGVPNPSYNNPTDPTRPAVPSNPAYPLNPGPAVNGGYYNPSVVQEAIPAAVVKSAPPGWNDPPMMSTKPKAIGVGQGDMSALHAGTRQWGLIIDHRRHATEPKSESSGPALAPITHPLGAEPPQHVPLSGPPAYAPQQYAPQQYTPQQYAPQQYAPQQYAPQQYPGQQYQQQTAPPAAAPAPPVVAPPAAPQKPPVPEEHARLQTFFDSLRSECSVRASNPQMKRKLEDVQRKLESLYDLLREYRLSESALGSLHTSVQFASSCQYEAALQAATVLATGPEFSTVAGFLPGLKVLYQLAHQLQAQLR